VRTGTKFAGVALLWGVIMTSAVIVTMLILTARNPEYKDLWNYVPAIITALLGQGVLNFCGVELRKALETRAYKIVGEFLKKYDMEEKFQEFLKSR